jgi:hypothetical protein
MAATPGYQGQVKISASVIANIKSNQFDMQRQMDDVTVMLATPSPFKVFAPVLIDATFQITANWDLADTNGQLAMQNALIAGTLLSFVVTPNNGTNTYVFSGYIKKIGVKTDVSKINEASYDIQPSGVITTT